MNGSDIHIVDPCTSEEWRQFISTHPDAGIFHHPSWLRMLRDVYGFRIFAVCVKQENAIRAGVPFADIQSAITGRRWVSLPFSDYCKPLLPGNNPKAADSIISYLRNEGTPISNIEIRWGVKSRNPVYTRESFVNHTLPLTGGLEQLFKSFNRPTTQRHIRNSGKSGLTLKECNSVDEFMQFYHLQVTTRKRLGVPAQPKDFFKAVWNYMLQPGLGYCLLACKDDRPLAGGVFFRFGQTTFYKYGASDYKYHSLNPNYAIMWQAIQRAIGEGHTVFDLGRSDKNNEGLRRFKNGWGTIESVVPYTFLKNVESNHSLPLVNSIAGAVIRNSPRFVCTVSGELLYKHFA